jgi:hypothetical protein
LFFDLKNVLFTKVFDDFSFDICFSQTNFIMSKHHQGGQSSQRFERNRNNEIVKWFKTINELLRNTSGSFKVFCQEFYYRQFYELLTTENQNRITSRESAEFFNEDGVYQLINKLKS